MIILTFPCFSEIKWNIKLWASNYVQLKLNINIFLKITSTVNVKEEKIFRRQAVNFYLNFLSRHNNCLEVFGWEYSYSHRNRNTQIIPNTFKEQAPEIPFQFSHGYSSYACIKIPSLMDEECLCRKIYSYHTYFSLFPLKVNISLFDSESLNINFYRKNWWVIIKKQILQHYILIYLHNY